MSSLPFRVAFTADFFEPDGSTRYPDIGLSIFGEDTSKSVDWFKVSKHSSELTGDQIAGAQGVIVLTPAVTARSVAQSADLLAIGRFGVGYDAVDVTACTNADVAVFITVGAVDRSVAEATVGWMIALTHNMIIKDKLVRTGQWDERSRHMGRELRQRTFGAIGLGGIGRATVGLLRGFGMNEPLAYDPFLNSDIAKTAGVKSVSLDQLLAQADFVSIHCPLTDKTRGLIGARELALMKPDAYLINTARGGIVDEDALYDALVNQRIAGAALDCFAEEPVIRPHRFGTLDNVVLAPHSIAWTEELFRDIGRAACQGMLDLARGNVPRGVINREVLQKPRFLQKWARFQTSQASS